MTKNEHDQRIQENKQQRESVDQKLFTLTHLSRKGVSAGMGKSHKSNNNKLYFFQTVGGGKSVELIAARYH